MLLIPPAFTVSAAPTTHDLIYKTQFGDYNHSQMPSTESSLLPVYQLQACIQSDLLACDARWSLFVAAVTSYRYESLVWPFPKEFVNSAQRLDIDRIYGIISDMPRLEAIEQQLIHCMHGRCWPDLMKLLHAVLVRHGKRVAISSLRSCEFEDLFAHLHMCAPDQMPNHIFEVTPNPKCSHTKAYVHLRQLYPIRIVYYGGKLEHFYAMMTTGGLPNDEPLVLTSDVDEALKLSPACAGWGGSRCGSVLRCVAIIELVCAPHFVETQLQKRQCTQSYLSSRHFLVQDASCVQISYLMIHSQSCEQYEAEQTCQQLENWADANKSIVSLSVYIMIMSFGLVYGRDFFRCFARTGLDMLKRSFLAHFRRAI